MLRPIPLDAPVMRIVLPERRCVTDDDMLRMIVLVVAAIVRGWEMRLRTMRYDMC